MIIQMWEGIPLQIPEKMVPEFANIFGGFTYNNFPDDFCGSGKIGEKMVPDYIYEGSRLLPRFLDISIKISPACAIHDTDWDLAEPTWDAFHETNLRLHDNIATIIQCRTKPGILQLYAMAYPDIYKEAVETMGRIIFWRLKKAQGHAIPSSAEWHL